MACGNNVIQKMLSAFLKCGAGLIWCILWLTLAYESPQEHPRISSTERVYIVDGIGTVVYAEVYGLRRGIYIYT